MKKFLVLLFTIISISFFALPGIVSAAEFTGITQRSLASCTEGSGGNAVVTLDCVPIIFFNLVFWLLVFAGSIAVILIIISGIKFITSGGDPKQVEGARKTATWAIIGLVVIIMSFAIVKFIADVTGVECLKEFGFTVCSAAP